MVKKHIDTNQEKNLGDKIGKAFNLISLPVGTTFGPGGQNVLLKNMADMPLITKDGVTVAENIEVEDEALNLVISIIKEAASKTNREAGDGTTTAIVLAHEIYKEGMKFIAAGHKPVMIQRQIQSYINRVITSLNEMAIKVEEGNRTDILKKIASISMNGETEISDIVAEAVAGLGINSAITAQGSTNGKNHWYRVKGLKMNRGWTARSFCRESNTNKIIFEEPYILLTSHMLESPKQFSDLSALFETIAEKRKPILIISSGVTAGFLKYLLYHLNSGALVSCPTMPPYFGIVRYEFFKDLAAVTGARIIEEAQDELAAVKLEHLGVADMVEITDSSTVIMGGRGDDLAIARRKKYLESVLPKPGERDLDHVVERLSMLTGGVGTIEIAHSSHIELEEKKHRVEDACNACKAALQEGFLPGGGAGLLRAVERDSQNLKDDVGYKIISGSVKGLIKRMCENAGLAGDMVIDKLLKSEENKTIDISKPDYETKDAIEIGVIDPIKVTCCALANSASIAASLLTTGAIISDIPAKNNGVLEPYMPA